MPLFQENSRLKLVLASDQILDGVTILLKSIVYCFFFQEGTKLTADFVYEFTT